MTKAKIEKPICSVDGCENKSVSRGYCNKHYVRMFRYGSTAIPGDNEFFIEKVDGDTHHRVSQTLKQKILMSLLLSQLNLNNKENIVVSNNIIYHSGKNRLLPEAVIFDIKAGIAEDYSENIRYVFEFERNDEKRLNIYLNSANLKAYIALDDVKQICKVYRPLEKGYSVQIYDKSDIFNIDDEVKINLKNLFKGFAKLNFGN